jgi:hypothetical protein
MTVGLALLLHADTAPLAAAGGAFDHMSDACAELSEGLGSVRSASRERWTGVAAELADTALSSHRMRLAAAGLQLRALGSVLCQAAEEFRQAQGELRSVLAEAAAAGCTVADDGSVTGGPAAAGLADQVTRVLAAADRADRRAAAELDRSAERSAGLDLRTAHSQLNRVTDLVAGMLPAPGSSPTQVHTWWRRLSPDARRMLMHDQPQLVGSLDGVPCADREGGPSGSE